MPKAIWNNQVLAESDKTVVVDGKVNRDAAWSYPNASEAAQQVKGYVAFWRGVRVEA
ncbi:MAG: DUF427 domain-containing protein [Chloroflexi bacterium]|nr:DUF427 domain-containing protein [Chloroflexota bacterium]